MDKDSYMLAKKIAKIHLSVTMVATKLFETKKRIGILNVGDENM